MSWAKRTKDRKQKGVRLPPFSPILNEEMDSIAYQSLAGNAAKALPYFKRINGILIKKCGSQHNGLFDFTYTEAVKYGFSRRTFSRIITDLNEKGFIDIVSAGGLRGCGKSNSKYCLSERWRNYGKCNFLHRRRYLSEPAK